MFGNITVIFWISVCITWLFFAFVAAAVASHRGGDGALGFLIGFLFGPLGMVWAYWLGGEIEKDEKRLLEGYKKCPDCAEVVKNEARLCKFCRFDFTTLQLKSTERIQ